MSYKDNMKFNNKKKFSRVNKKIILMKILQIKLKFYKGKT